MLTLETHTPTSMYHFTGRKCESTCCAGGCMHYVTVWRFPVFVIQLPSSSRVSLDKYIFLRWMRHNMVPTSFPVWWYPHLSLFSVSHQINLVRLLRIIGFQVINKLLWICTGQINMLRGIRLLGTWCDWNRDVMHQQIFCFLIMLTSDDAAFYLLWAA